MGFTILKLLLFFTVTRRSRSPLRAVQPVLQRGEVQLQPRYIEESQVLTMFQGLATELDNLKKQMAETQPHRRLQEVLDRRMRQAPPSSTVVPDTLQSQVNKAN